MKPVIRPAWEILRFSTQSRTPSNEKSSLAVMIHSFDGYKRFWAAARYFTERAIPSKFPIYYVSERIPMHPDRARCIFTGKGGFSTRLAKGLEMISRSHEYVLYLQEDIWIDEGLSEEDLSEFVRYMDNYQLDCLKLGRGSFAPSERAAIISQTDRLPGVSNLRWFGPHSYTMGHHCSIFRSTYFWRTALLARLFRQERPLRNEFFVSEALRKQVKARNSDRKNIRIAIWDDTPLVSYIHSCIKGRLTPEGQELLEKHNILDLYDETLPGEILPKTTSDMLQMVG